MNFKEITVCLDMAGCPNRCRHCWLGVTPNGNLPISELEYTAEQFRPFTDCLKVYDWYREPDYKENYRELYALCNRLSDQPIEHFELISFWRIVRDREYVKWLRSLGLKNAQLTIFGGEETTDFYIGRKGAYAEILRAIEILTENRIAPRIQMFVNKNNINELASVENLIRSLDLEDRCESFDGKFSFFLHQGSCDGENEKLYDVRITPDDLSRIPPLLEAYTLRHFGKEKIADVFGQTERALYGELISDDSTMSYVSDRPVFYVDRELNVYPNVTSPSPQWRLGNLKKHGVSEVLENYTESKSAAQHTRRTVPLCEIVKARGSETSTRLFSKDDYTIFLLNGYCGERTEK